jgi:hypothetical protein
MRCNEQRRRRQQQRRLRQLRRLLLQQLLLQLSAAQRLAGVAELVAEAMVLSVSVGTLMLAKTAAVGAPGTLGWTSTTAEMSMAVAVLQQQVLLVMLSAVQLLLLPLPVELTPSRRCTHPAATDWPGHLEWRQVKAGMAAAATWHLSTPPDHAVGCAAAALAAAVAAAARCALVAVLLAVAAAAVARDVAAQMTMPMLHRVLWRPNLCDWAAAVRLSPTEATAPLMSVPPSGGAAPAWCGAAQLLPQRLVMATLTPAVLFACRHR